MRAPIESVNSSPYTAWISRIQRIQQAFAQGTITPEALPHYQRFILEFGQFNATFTLEELKQLNYPRSPLNNMHRHTYLRGTETWATEVLRQYYCHTHKTGQYDYPVFLDSALFWEDIALYATLINSADLLSDKAHESVFTILNTQKDTAVWIKLPSPKDKQTVADKLREITADYVIEHDVPENLRPVFKRNRYQYTEKEQILLEDFLQKDIKICKEDALKKRKLTASEKPGTIQWYGKLFGLIRKSLPEFLIKHEIKNMQDLKTFALSNVDEFEKLSAKLPIGDESEHSILPSVLCTLAVQRFMSRHIADLIDDFCYITKPEPFLGLNVLLIVGHKEARASDGWGPKSLINRLGYRVEIGQAIQAILKQNPKLFIDKTTTQDFWDYLVKTPMILSLPRSEQQLIAELPIQLETVPCFTNPVNFTEEIASFNRVQCDSAFALYQQFIADYVFNFLKFNAPDSATYQVMMPELCRVLIDFIDAYREASSPNLPKAVRAAQTVCEILSLDLAFHPHQQSFQLAEVIKKDYLRNYPVQHVLMAPYGMRAYARVFQAAGRRAPGAKTLNVFVTNQNYFEWPMSLNNLKGRNMNIIHVRQLEDIDQSADYIFAEIHPNNFTEKKQFLQNMSMLIERMRKQNWTHKPRTLVFDATLNAFDDPEVKSVLDSALPLIQNGSLVLILMQSLTKFSQLGLDIRSGGLMVVINNDSYWKLLNQNYNLIAAEEPVDDYTLQYFSYFFQAGKSHIPQVSLTVRYIDMINQKVNQLYDMILFKMAELECDYQTAFKLTISSDPKSCYVSFNTSSILSFIDPDFRHTTHDIELLNEDIVNDLLLPLCRAGNLPLTNRMSIAFPLSSVNYALDSARFTVGLEQHTDMIKYAHIIAYIAKQLNYELPLQDLFIKDQRNMYAKRKELFATAVSGYTSYPAHRYAALTSRFDNCIYGPFKSVRGPVYFFYTDDGLNAWINKRLYRPNQIVIMQEQMYTPCIKMSAERFDEFIRGSAYTINKDAGEFHQHYPRTSTQCIQFMPLGPDRTNILFTAEGFGVERDYVCAKKHGITVFKRFYSLDTTAIELDYWQEKDSAVGRFLNFAVALYVKRVYGAGFKVRCYQDAVSSMYTQFLFWMKYDDADRIFQEALDKVHTKRDDLLKVLSSYQSKPKPVNDKPYPFFTVNEPGAGYTNILYKGPTKFVHASLIASIQDVLGIRKTPARSEGLFKKGFLLNNPVAAAEQSERKGLGV